VALLLHEVNHINTFCVENYLNLLRPTCESPVAIEGPCQSGSARRNLGSPEEAAQKLILDSITGACFAESLGKCLAVINPPVLHALEDKEDSEEENKEQNVSDG